MERRVEIPSFFVDELWTPHIRHIRYANIIKICLWYKKISIIYVSLE